jgi:hypothetical protein
MLIFMQMISEDDAAKMDRQGVTFGRLIKFKENIQNAGASILMSEAFQRKVLSG